MHNLKALAREAWKSGDSPAEACVALRDALLEMGWDLTDDEVVDYVRDVVGANVPPKLPLIGVE